MQVCEGELFLASLKLLVLLVDFGGFIVDFFVVFGFFFPEFEYAFNFVGEGFVDGIAVLVDNYKAV